MNEITPNRENTLPKLNRTKSEFDIEEDVVNPTINDSPLQIEGDTFKESNFNTDNDATVVPTPFSSAESSPHRQIMVDYVKSYLGGQDEYEIKIKNPQNGVMEPSGQVVKVEDLVDMFIKSSTEHGIDPRFALALHISETSLINYTTKNNPGNVGNNETGGTRRFDTLEQGVDALTAKLAQFARGERWSRNNEAQNTLERINGALIDANGWRQRDTSGRTSGRFPTHYMGKHSAVPNIIRIVQGMGWNDFGQSTPFTATQVRTVITEND